jgi:glucose/arabinose dehydrogenase
VDRRLIVIAVVLLIAAALMILVLRQESPAGELRLEPVYEGLAFPVSLAVAPDGRWFYNELREGNVRIIQDGIVLERPFVSLNVVRLAETGLLGLTLHPDFSQVPYVYVYYTYDSGEGIFNRISRFRDMGNVAGPEEVILDRIPANSRHNGGRLTFGPDGKLYATVGDTLEPQEAQDPDSLAGKILRMNPDGSIPEDNPIAGSYTYLLGVRNSFGIGFTPGGTLLFTENGPVGNDEVNRGMPGKNYGWPDVQGFSSDPRYEDPLVVFPRAIAPTGIAFFAGGSLGESFANAVYFVSWNDGAMRRIRGDVEGGSDDFQAETVLSRGPGGLLDVVEGLDGYLYVTHPDGISRVVQIDGPSSQGVSPDSGLTASERTSYPMPRSLCSPAFHKY